MLPIINHFIQDLIRNISGPLGIRVRRWYYQTKFEQCGVNLVISEGVYIDQPRNISLGNNVWLDKGVIIITGKIERPNMLKKSQDELVGKFKMGNNAHIGIRSVVQAHGGISIGDSFTCGTDAKIYTLSNEVTLSKNGTHHSDKSQLYYRENTILIGNNVWCGMNSIILKGPVNDNVFIHPNSVCFSEIDSNSIVSGNPAIKIKNRFL